VTASSVENPGILLASARRLEHLAVAQEEEDEVETVVADPLDLAITVAKLDTCLVTVLRREPPQTPAHATTATRRVICPGTAHQMQAEVAVVKNLASATNVVRRVTCPVTAQVLLLHHNPLVDATSATHAVSRITCLVTAHKRATVRAT